MMRPTTSEKTERTLMGLKLNSMQDSFTLKIGDVAANFNSSRNSLYSNILLIYTVIGSIHNLKVILKWL